MALQIAVTWQDAYGRTSTKRYGSDRTLLADAATDAAALIAAMGDISGAGTVKFEVIQVTPAINAPVALSNLDAGATIHCRLANGKLYPLHVPAILATKINSDGSVDVADADIVTFVELFESGGHFTVSEGDLVTAPEYAELDR
jgi:hypothetical protein